jgi:hypothetical protein
MARFLVCAVVAILAAVGIIGCGDDSGSSVSARDQTQPTTTTTVKSTTEADFVGLTKNAAIAKAKAGGRLWRISREDSESFPGTLDYNPDRVNFEIDNGTVTSAIFG